MMEKDVDIFVMARTGGEREKFQRVVNAKQRTKWDFNSCVNPTDGRAAPRLLTHFSKEPIRPK